MNNDYVQIWNNNTKRAFKLLLADIQPPNAGKTPAPDYELPADGKYELQWKYPPPNGNGETSGFLRFWAIPSTPGKMGSGLTFGVKTEEDFIMGEPQPLKVFTYLGSPTGNPNSWTDVTDQLDPDYNFFFRGEGMLESYGVNISRLLGPRASIAITIETLYMGPTTAVYPGTPDYVEEWVNESDHSFELEQAVVSIGTDKKPTKVLKPKPGSHLPPRGVAVLAWSYDIPDGSGQTYGYLRYWSVKPAPPPGPIGGGEAFGVMVEQGFAASTSKGEKSIPEPPQVKIFNGFVSAGPNWEDISKQLDLQGSYTFVVKHKPHDFLVTVEQLMSIYFSRCAVRVTIQNADAIQ